VASAALLLSSEEDDQEEDQNCMTRSGASVTKRIINGSDVAKRSIDEEVNARGLRASLDNGMADVRRWI
jgi:hypothetical protein